MMCCSIEKGIKYKSGQILSTTTQTSSQQDRTSNVDGAKLKYKYVRINKVRYYLQSTTN